MSDGPAQPPGTPAASRSGLGHLSVSRVLAAVRERVPDWALRTIGAYLASRVVVAFAVAVAYFSVPAASVGPWESLPARWDGFWYTYIAEQGYPPDLAGPSPQQRGSPWAFFPLFPLAMRVVGAATGTGVVAAGILLNVVLGVALALVVNRLTLATTDDESTAERAVVLVAVWPGSAAFSLIYSEPLFLFLAALTLLLLLRHRWWQAGVAAALATGTRPSGVAVIAACALAALMAVVRRREWRALVAPALSPVGLVCFLGYARLRTGAWDAWLQAEETWKHRLDLSRRLPRLLAAQLGNHGVDALGGLLVLFAFVAVVAAVGLLVAGRFALPPEQLAYTAGTLFLALGYTSVGTRPRMVAVMLPLFWVVARRVRGRVFDSLVVILAGVLGLTTFLYLAGRHVVP